MTKTGEFRDETVIFPAHDERNHPRQRLHAAAPSCGGFPIDHFSEDKIMSEIPKKGPAACALLAMATMICAASAQARPVPLSSAQMDVVAAGGVETVEGFVCPVITTSAVLAAPNGGELGVEGYYTIGGPDVTVPKRATNGEGTATPSGPFSAPGDTDYTAIWGVRP